MGSHALSVWGTLGVKVCVLSSEILLVKVCVLGGAMPAVQGARGVNVCMSWGVMPAVQGTIGVKCVSWGEPCLLSFEVCVLGRSCASPKMCV